MHSSGALIPGATVTLTEVQVSKDLSYAKVFYSVLVAEMSIAQQILDEAAGMLRGPVGRAVLRKLKSAAGSAAIRCR